MDTPACITCAKCFGKEKSFERIHEAVFRGKWFKDRIEFDELLRKAFDAEYDFSLFNPIL